MMNATTNDANTKPPLIKIGGKIVPSAPELISLIYSGIFHFTKTNTAVIIPPMGNIYFDDKLSITSKKVSPKKNESPNILAKLIPPPSDREQNIPITVTIDPNNNVAFLRDQFF